MNLRAAQHGFTLVELLIALGIVMSIGAVLASVVPSARVAFERVPADLDLQQRGRTAIDVLSLALRSSGANVVATAKLGPLSELLPTVLVDDETGVSGVFRTLTVISPVSTGAQGVLDVDQASTGGPMTFAATPCPSAKDVCGFAPGTTAMIVDGLGAHEVFAVGGTDPAALSLTPDRPLSRVYPAGSAIVEIDQNTYRLAAQADGSDSLIRVTAAGAVQPIVDFVVDLSFEVRGEDVPAGFFRADQINVSVRVQAATEAIRRLVNDRVFKTSVRLRNAS
ncbi:MAG TPA: type II secretion system protein [Vicinamibacterales bacterium]